jgi:hypothetical protein
MIDPDNLPRMNGRSARKLGSLTVTLLKHLDFQFPDAASNWRTVQLLVTSLAQTSGDYRTPVD